MEVFLDAVNAKVLSEKSSFPMLHLILHRVLARAGLDIGPLLRLII